MADAKIHEARVLLRQHWKHEDFRPGQRQAISAVLQGRDVLLVMATGGGKSVCYQLPGLLMQGLTLVVSPLVALMQDQVAALTARGISATLLQSTLSKRLMDKRLSEAEDGRYSLLYVSPERLRSRNFRARVPRLMVSLMAVDEAHCISVWGHDFRPSYRMIPEIYELLERPPVIATTGTATPRVQEDIARGLQQQNPTVIVGKFDRPNINLRVAFDTDPASEVRQILASYPGSGIVYAGSRRNVTRWADSLARDGHIAVKYHAGLTARQRTSALNKWSKRKARVVVATNAFGMGIDKPDVRFVVHLEPPYSLEAYYQEAGRAGRDGKASEALLISGSRDGPRQEAIVDRRYPTPEEVRAVYGSVCSMAQIALGSMPGTPVPVDLAAASRETGLSPPAVERIIHLISEEGAWRVLPGHLGSGMIRMRQPADAIRRYSQTLRNDDRYRFIIALLRAVGADAYRDWEAVDLGTLASELMLSQSQLASELAFLSERGILSWRTVLGDLRVRFTRERTESLAIDHAALWQNRRRALEQLYDMRRYVKATQCRGQLLLRYFGEQDPAPCGHCDLCRSGAAVVDADQPMLRQLLAQVKNRIPFSRDEAHTQDRERLLNYLISEEYVRIRSGNRLMLSEKGEAWLKQWPARSP